MPGFTSTGFTSSGFTTVADDAGNAPWTLEESDIYTAGAEEQDVYTAGSEEEEVC